MSYSSFKLRSKVSFKFTINMILGYEQYNIAYLDVPVDKLSIDSGCREHGAVCFGPGVHRHLSATVRCMQDYTTGFPAFQEDKIP